MIKKTTCMECDNDDVNCIEIGMDGNWVCIACLRYNLDLYNTRTVFESSKDYGKVYQRTEKIDSDDVPF